MLCERCNQQKASLIYRENLSGSIRTRRLCGACTEALEAAGELEELGDALAPFASPLLIAENRDIFPPLPNKTDTCKSASSDNEKSKSSDSSTAPSSDSDTSAEDPTCPLCGASARDLRATGRAGCARCYSAWREGGQDPALGIIRAEHLPVYRGRLPAEAKRKRQVAERLAALRRDLSFAVSDEEFERAAKIRDEIRRLDV